MLARENRNYSDCLYFVQALANCVYPMFRPLEKWRRGIFDEVAIPYTDEPTISQLWLIEDFLLGKIIEMHEQTAQLALVEKSPLTETDASELARLDQLIARSVKQEEGNT